MAEADRATTGGTLRAAVRSPLLGRRSGRTAAALGYLGVLVLLFAARYAGRVLVLGGAPLESHTAAFDTLSAVLIAATTASLVAAPIGYAIWNGGPLLSFAFPLVPVAVPELVAGRYALDLDWAIALSVGATAAAVAHYGTDVRAAGTWRPWRTAPIDEDRLLVVTACCLGALAVAGTFVAWAPADVHRRYRPFAALFVVPVGLVVRYWSARLRAAVRTTAGFTDL